MVDKLEIRTTSIHTIDHTIRITKQHADTHAQSHIRVSRQILYRFGFVRNKSRKTDNENGRFEGKFGSNRLFVFGWEGLGARPFCN